MHKNEDRNLIKYTKKIFLYTSFVKNVNISIQKCLMGGTRYEIY